MKSTFPTCLARSPTGSLPGLDVASPDLLDPGRARAAGALARIDPGVEPPDQERQRAEQADRSRSKDHRVQPPLLLLGRVDPGHADQHGVELDERFFGDGERLREDGDVGDLPWHHVHVVRRIDHLVGHEAVPAHDAALGVGAGDAEVRPVVVAGAALGVAAGATHRRDHQIAGLEVLDCAADLDDLAQRLVTHHQVLLAGRRGAVLESGDIAIGPADADLQHPDPRLLVPLQLGDGRSTSRIFFSVGNMAIARIGEPRCKGGYELRVWLWELVKRGGASGFARRRPGPPPAPRACERSSPRAPPGRPESARRRFLVALAAHEETAFHKREERVAGPIVAGRSLKPHPA